MIRVHGCLECGRTGPLDSRAEFCRPACRTAWNNRRRVRGAELYDLYMAHRFDRAEAQALGVFPAVNRLASLYREEDQARREGRRSWRQPRVVLAEQPHLRASRGPSLAGGPRR
ncbi:hypothetical protein STVA_41800 [Allostella vacuolata]|nr:hypothetical protein STVA_41800 [Stella vacuolata]